MISWWQMYPSFKLTKSTTKNLNCSQNQNQHKVIPADLSLAQLSPRFKKNYFPSKDNFILAKNEVSMLQAFLNSHNSLTHPPLPMLVALTLVP